MFGGLAWSEWWTYRPSDFLMFSPRIYWRLFEQVNAVWWPAAAALAALLLAALWRRAAWACGAVLGAAWLLVAWAYHHQRFAPISGAAEVYALVFAAQGLLLPLLLRHGRLQPRAVAQALLAAALAGWPLLAALGGRPWQQAELFGLAPDPNTAATVALLLMWRPATAWTRLALGVVPALWCAGSAATLATMASWQALAPLAALALAGAWCARRDAR
jgi:hypothetical protein